MIIKTINAKTMATGRDLTENYQTNGDWGWYIFHSHHNTQKKAIFSEIANGNLPAH